MCRSRSASESFLPVLDAYPATATVGDLCEADTSFAEAIGNLTEEFEYQNFSWMTIAQAKSHFTALL